MSINIHPKKHYTVEQIAKMFCHRVQWVEKLIAEGEFAKDAATGLISGAALCAWLDRGVRPQPKRPRVIRGKQERLGLIGKIEPVDFHDSFPVTLLSGGYIYFLLDQNDGVLYVGKTVSLYARIATHWNVGKRFTRVAYRAVSIEQLDEQEALFIAKYNPPLNRVDGGGFRL